MKEGYVDKNTKDLKLSSSDLEMINKLTRRNFEENEVYTFNVVLCDNEIDREHERFTDEALDKLAKLFVGKTGILDHNPTSGNQTARIYKCYTEFVKGKFNKLKMPYKRLVAKAYMPKSEKNENIILEIDSGIKKEVSVGCSVERKICSICSQNVNEAKCAHKKGRRYKIENTYKTCHYILDDPNDAYEWSFVAVPAQREAGVIKAFLPTATKGGEKNMEEVIKSLSSGQAVTLNEQEALKIHDLIKNLKEKAELGNYYKEELKSEVVRLSSLVQPEVSTELMKSITNKFSIEELKAFKKCFQSKISKSFPIKPQFVTEKSEEETLKNVEFKI